MPSSPFRRARPALLALALAGGCARTGASANAPVVVNIQHVAGQAVQEGAGAAQGVCTLYLKAEPITKSASGCFVDERVSKGLGVLTFPCSGDGPAQAVFGRDRYEGDVRGSKLALALETELDWNDGCHWQTHHAIKGSLERGGSSEIGGSLSWQYADNPTDNGGGDDEAECSGSCTASTRLHMTVTRPAEPKHAVEEEMLHLRSP